MSVSAANPDDTSTLGNTLENDTTSVANERLAALEARYRALDARLAGFTTNAMPTAVTAKSDTSATTQLTSSITESPSSDPTYVQTQTSVDCPLSQSFDPESQSPAAALLPLPPSVQAGAASPSDIVILRDMYNRVPPSLRESFELSATYLTVAQLDPLVRHWETFTEKCLSDSQVSSTASDSGPSTHHP
jgi:hypothetical protein